MMKNRISVALRIGGSLLAATSLSACLGSGGGGGGGGGGPVDVTQYDADLQRVQGIIPTSDMQTTGTANYKGATKLDITKGATGHVIGDVEVDVDFAAANDKAISGTASNWRGVVNGEDVSFPGTLSTGTRFPSSFTNDELNVPTPPGGAIPGAPTKIRPGAASIAMYGDIDEQGQNTTGVGNESSLVLLTLSGNFVGPQGQAIHGPALIQQITGTSIAERAGAGTFYVERQ